MKIFVIFSQVIDTHDNQVIATRDKMGKSIRYAMLVVLICISLVSIYGCNKIITGRHIEQERLSLLKENETTKSEVIKLLGKPEYIMPGADGKGEIFTYRHTQWEMFSSYDDTEKQRIILLIDDADILRKITVFEKNSLGF